MPSITVSARAGEKSFKCPNCTVLAQHNWSTCFVNWTSHIDGNCEPLKNPIKANSEPQDWNFAGQVRCAECQVCNNISLWMGERMIFPIRTDNVPDPNNDMPDSIKSIYKEAANISLLSPRASAALLRLCVEKLLDKLNIAKEEKNLFDRIGKAKLALETQQAADIIRIIGNDGIHTGEIKLEENNEVLEKLFLLLNFMVTKLITEPNMTNEIFDTLPDSKKKGIKERDNKYKKTDPEE